MPSYELWMTDDTGKRLSKGSLNITLGFVCSKVVNGVGRLAMRLPASFNRDLIIPDSTMVQVWRTPAGGQNSLWNTYNIDGFKFSHVDSEERIEIYGADMMDLLRRREIAYYTESDYTDKDGPADDIIKEFVDEQLVNPVLYNDTGTPDTAREINGLSIASDLGDGPNVTRRAAWSENLLDTCQRVAEAARNAGNEVFFDIIPLSLAQTPLTWKFVTSTGQPGADLTSGTSQVVFSQERKNMRNPEYSEDWADSANYVYGGGPGEASARVVETTEDTTRSLRGIYARREGYAEARNQKADSVAVQDAANTELESQRPQRDFNAIPIDAPGTRFGVHWNLGDKVVAEYLDFRFPTIIRGVQINYSPSSGEKVAARLEWRES